MSRFTLTRLNELKMSLSDQELRYMLVMGKTFKGITDKKPELVEKYPGIAAFVDFFIDSIEVQVGDLNA